MRPTKRLSLIEHLVLQSYWVGLSFMWNSLHIIILPAVLLTFVPETQKNTYLGILTFFGLIIAMIIQPISGALSDRWVSRLGRRRPLMLIGTLFDFVFLGLLAWSGGLLWLAVGYIGLQFSSNIAHGPAQGLQPDLVPAEQMGTASGFKNIMDMLGLVVASLLMGRMVPPDVVHPVTPMLVVMIVLAVFAVITLAGVRERPFLKFEKPAATHPDAVQPAPEIHASRSYWWLIASRFAFLLGIYDIQVFAQYYVRDVVATPNPVQVTGDLLAVITLGLMAFAMIGGWMGDRLGHTKILVLAGLVSGVGCLLLYFGRTPSTLLIFGSVLGAGIGLFMTSNWALANELAPNDAAGKFLGFTNLATAGSGAVARLGGPLIDLLNNRWPGMHWGYTGMFIFGAVCTLTSIWLLQGVRAVPPAEAWQASEAEKA